MKLILVSFVILFSGLFNSPNISEAKDSDFYLKVQGLQLRAQSSSTIHAYILLGQTENQNQGAQLVDIICNDGDIRLRLRTSQGIKEFRSQNDFYCYSALAFIKKLNSTSTQSCSLNSILQKRGEQTVMTSLLFKFEDGTEFDFYKIKGSTLIHGPFVEN